MTLNQNLLLPIVKQTPSLSSRTKKKSRLCCGGGTCTCIGSHSLPVLHVSVPSLSVSVITLWIGILLCGQEIASLLWETKTLNVSVIVGTSSSSTTTTTTITSTSATTRSSSSKRAVELQFLPEKDNKLFCVPWQHEHEYNINTTTTTTTTTSATQLNTDLDTWWEHHPTWQIGEENATHTCFTPMLNTRKAAFFLAVYKNQYHNNCSLLQKRNLVPIGFAATLDFVRAGFWTSLQQGRPFVPSKYWHGFRWMYTPPYDFENNMTTIRSSPSPSPHSQSQSPWAACPTRDLSCYFLPLSNCTPPAYSRDGDIPVQARRIQAHIDSNVTLQYQHMWLMEYILRPKEVTRYQLQQQIWQSPNQPSALQQLLLNDHNHNKNNTTSTSSQSCIWFHVRRADAASEPQHPRHFYSLAQYLQAAGLYHDEFGQSQPQSPQHRSNSTTTTITDRTEQEPLILLLTDDQTTLDEAQWLHPTHNFVAIHRTRYRGTGKMTKHSHIPSHDPALEILYILAELQLASHCRVGIHATSHMVTLFRTAMLQRHEDLFHLKWIAIDNNTTTANAWQPQKPQPIRFVRALDRKIQHAQQLLLQKQSSPTQE